MPPIIVPDQTPEEALTNTLLRKLIENGGGGSIDLTPVVNKLNIVADKIDLLRTLLDDERNAENCFFQEFIKDGGTPIPVIVQFDDWRADLASPGNPLNGFNINILTTQFITPLHLVIMYSKI